MKLQPPATPNFYEQTAWGAGKLVCGIDEAGRGCLAGPVVVGAVVLPQGAHHKLLRDSKTMTAPQREEAFAWISANARWQAAWAGVSIIEQINIYQATKQAMLRCFLLLLAKHPALETELTTLAVDAVPIDLATQPRLAHIAPRSFNFGESLSTSIAAASIVAKVTRDRLLTAMERSFPAYQLAQHKGYASQQHTAAIQGHGASIVHRGSFLSNIVGEKKEQLSLF